MVWGFEIRTPTRIMVKITCFYLRWMIVIVQKRVELYVLVGKHRHKKTTLFAIGWEAGGSLKLTAVCCDQTAFRPCRIHRFPLSQWLDCQVCSFSSCGDGLKYIHSNLLELLGWAESLFLVKNESFFNFVSWALTLPRSFMLMLKYFSSLFMEVESIPSGD